MDYVNSAIATLADAIELDFATNLYETKANEDLHTLPKATLLRMESQSILELAADRLKRCGRDFDLESCNEALNEISKRKIARKRSIEVKKAREFARTNEQLAFA